MLQQELISRAILKTKGRKVPEFYGLTETEFREVAVLGHHCEKELGLSTTGCCSLGSDSGVRYELGGKKHNYSVSVTRDGVTLNAGSINGDGQPRQLFRHNLWNHSVAGELFRIIKSQENRKW